VGQGDEPLDQVKNLAELTHKSDLDGVVCSPHEIGLVRASCGDDFITMVPGIRPAGSDIGDQKRFMTPFDAVQMGVTHMVIGRPITGSENPRRAAEDILQSLKP
jgi:orotidine-5'-phosphate decarboxylase